MHPKLKLFPLFFLYLLVIFLRSSATFEGDEGRYVMYAENLSHGYYATPGSVQLQGGPGYPLVLLPIVLLKLPWMAAKMMNGVFLFLAVLYFFSTLRLYLSEKPAFYFSYLFGIYPFFLKYIQGLYSETFAIFLVCGFLFHFCNAFRTAGGGRLQAFLAAVYLGYLALTRVFFGYVILAGLLVFFMLYVWKKRKALKRIFLIYALALLFCTPYLLYTYSLTGKIFYWATVGGSNLYWISTPFEEELGDWQGTGVGHLQKSGNPDLIKHHGRFFEEVSLLDDVEWDKRMQAKALSHIYHHPRKFLKNWICNVGRMLFNYPYSYTPQRMGTLFNIFSNMFIVVFSILCIYPTYMGRKKIPFEIFALLFFGLISFGGISLLAAYERYCRPIVPIFILWILITLTQVMKIEIRNPGLT